MVIIDSSLLELGQIVTWIYSHSFDCDCPGYWACPNGENGWVDGIA